MNFANLARPEIISASADLPSYCSDTLHSALAAPDAGIERQDANQYMSALGVFGQSPQQSRLLIMDLGTSDPNIV